MVLIKFERNYERTKTYIEDILKTNVSETVTLVLKDGTLDVKLHLLLLPCDFLRTLLTDTEECKVIFMPDIEREDMVKVIELITTGDTPYKDKRGEEITDLLYFVLHFDIKLFSFDQHKTWANLDRLYKGVEAKKHKKEKKVPSTVFNVYENERQVFITDDFTCKYCLKYFDRKDHLKEHIKMCPKAQSMEALKQKINSRKCFKCEMCDKALSSKEALRKHELTHSEITDFSCPSCDKSFSSLTNLRRHIKASNHEYPDPEKYKMFTSQNIPENFVQCEICGRWVGRLEHHMKTHHSEKSRVFECDYEHCDYKTDRIDNFKRHKEDMHKCIARNFEYIDKTFEGREVDWKCFDCKDSLNTELEIENHVKSKHCDELKCIICDKKFKKKQPLVQHISQIHENPERHNCPKCDNSYSNKRNLTKHMKKCKK